MLIRLFLLFTVLVGQAQANDIERRYLSELVKEIDFLSQRVDEIRPDAPDDRRLRFQYDDLKRDLRLLREGIRDYIEADLREGRVIKPLSGRYR